MRWAIVILALLGVKAWTDKKDRRDHLWLRGFAGDYLIDGSTPYLIEVNDVSAATELPPAWVLAIRERGHSGPALLQAAHQVKEKADKMPLPASSSAADLDNFKAQALGGF